MSLYADISEANKYPSRNDLHKCVFNKDRNVSVCDRKWQNLFIDRNSPGILRPLRLNYNTASIAFVHLEKIPLEFCGLPGSTTTQCQSLWIWSLFCPRWKEICVYTIHPRHASFWLYEGYYDDYTSGTSGKQPLSSTTQRQSLLFISRNSPGILRPPRLNFNTVSIALNLKFILSSKERDMRLCYPSPTCIFLITIYMRDIMIITTISGSSGK